MWVTIFSSLHSSSFHRRRTIEYEGELCIRIPRFLRFTLSLPLLVPRPFILFSGRSFSGTTPRSRPFRRERSLNFPLPLLAFTSHRFRRSRLDASSSPRDVTYRSALQRLRGRASKMPPFQAVSPFPRENLKNGSAYRETFRLSSNMFSYKGYILRDSQ